MNKALKNIICALSIMCFVQQPISAAVLDEPQAIVVIAGSTAGMVISSALLCWRIAKACRENDENQSEAQGKSCTFGQFVVVTSGLTLVASVAGLIFGVTEL